MAFSSRKPEFVIVPGAWHSPESFKPTTDILKSKGYKVHGIHLPSVGASPPLSDFQPDIEAIRKTINPLIASQTPLILIFHSYGGVVGSSSLSTYISSLPPNTSPTNPSGPIIHLVYVSAFVLPLGVSLLAALNHKPPPWFDIHSSTDNTLPNTTSTIPSPQFVTPITPEQIFYNDISTPQQEEYTQLLKAHSYETFKSPVMAEPWRYIPSTYVFCEGDNAIPVQAQEGMVEVARGIAAGEEGGGCFAIVERTSAGHSPFISQPEWLAEKLMKAAGSRAGGGVEL